MTEQNQASLLRLPIDQEVYMDTVQDETVVGDATVATEIVLFERVGDAYVLEGAIVFAGYVSHEQVEKIGPVVHIHQRLPFVLRVPIHSQPKGILNVKSRLSGWKIEVAGRGWLRVLGELQIAGLSGGNGYHFECGGQQLGDPLFGEAMPEDVEAVSTVAPVTAPKAIELEAAQTRQIEASGLTQQSVEQLSEARGGHGLEALEFESKLPVQPSHERADVSEVKPLQQSVREVHAVEELANFDRFFTTEAQKEGTSQTNESVSGEAKGTSGLVGQIEPLGASMNLLPIAEFEFEHQLSPDEIMSLQHQGPPPKPQTETFVASRSFTSDGFHATSGFTLQQQNEALIKQNEALLKQLNAERTSASGPEPDNRKGEFLSKQIGEDGAGESLWSFVDFNGPEKTHTLRYIIVAEEETLETVADRIHCTKSELIRVNLITTEVVTPGQPLLIPEVPFTLSRR